MTSEKELETPTRERPQKKTQSTRRVKPKFLRQESWRYKRIRENWRSPRGIDSKIRKKVKGWPRSPEAGYRSPKGTRGLHPSGYEEIHVQRVEDLDKIAPSKQAVRVASMVGAKKRVDILARAEGMGIKILNPRRIKELEELKEEGEAKEEEPEKTEEVKES